MYTGPHIIKDGLVFGYDTGYGIADNDTATRFYPGANTVNYTTDTPSQGGWTGSYNVIDSSRKKFRFNVSNFAANPGAGWRSFTWDLRAYTGQSVTISATVEVPDASPGTFAWIMMGQGNTGTNSSGAGGYMGYSASSERVQKTTTTKERITWSGTLGNSGTASQPSGHVGFTVWYNNGVPGTNSYVEVSDVQIELKSHETPFVNGTRSSTASLIDLKETASIDVSNVSFDSTGQPDFDGTSDYITFGNNFLVPGISQYDTITNFTIDVWVNWDTFAVTGTHDEIISWWRTGSSTYVDGFLGTTKAGGGSATNPCIRFGDGWANTGVTFTAATDVGKWFNIVAIKTSNNAYVYVNGVLRATKGSALSWGFNDYPAVGRHPNLGEWLDGKVSNIKLYNTALTAAQVTQNYNAQKSRFI